MQKTTNDLTFGIMPGLFPPWQRMVEWAQLIEALKFDKLWLPDHFANPEDSSSDWLECWTLLGALAAQTKNITIGTLVSSMTLRNPALLARAALSLDHISGGRLELGVGAAGASSCHSMTGVPRWEPRERSERYREFVEILDSLLNHELTTYDGKYYSTQEALLQPGFVSQPRPVLNVAAHGPKALRLAARYGDAWNSLSTGADRTPRQSSDLTRERCEKMCAFAVEAGRDPDQIGRTFGFGWTSDDFTSSPDAFCDTIGRYREAGINDFAFIYVPGQEQYKGRAFTSREQLEWAALEAIPRLRKDLG